MKLHVNVNIMMGLPGSGKSYYAEKNDAEIEKREDYSLSRLFSADKYIGKPKEYVLERLSEEIAAPEWAINRRLTFDRTVDYYMFVDGLFLTNESIHEVIDAVKKGLNKNFANKYDLTFTIHQWDENRENCLKNDILRIEQGKREKSASAIIENSPYEKFNLAEFNEKYPSYKFKLVHHEVEVFSPYDLIVQEHVCLLKSEEWSLGGTWEDCLGNGGNIDPDPEVEFKEFDELIDKLCPNITHKNYMTIWNACVNRIEEREDGYYGGYEDRAHYECDLDNLRKELEKLGIFTVENLFNNKNK